MSDAWPVVHAERAALVTDLEQLDDPSWDAASLCERWTVHDVVAHVVDTAVTTRVGFLVDLGSAVRVTATDSDLDIGEGPRVSGPTLSLLLALSGRRVALTDLDGVGVGRLSDLL